MLRRRFFAKLIALITVLTVAAPTALPVTIGHAEGDAPKNPLYMPLISKPAAIVPAGGGNARYVAPNGSSSGDGSQSKPWDLQTALNHPSAVKPGDTIWLLGGTYRGGFTSRLKGASGAPITVRAVPGQRVTLDDTDKVLTIAESAYVNFWGLEITNSANRRSITSSPGGNDGILIDKGKSSHHIKFINMIVHDMAGQGFAWWDTNEDSEIYGSLVYYNGVNQFDHGIYTQNQDGAKLIANSFIFDNASHGIHAYGSDSSYIHNYTVQGNTLFNNGSIGYNTSKGSYGNYARNILVGGSSKANNPVIDSNYSYLPAGNGTTLNLGFNAGSNNGQVTNNVLANGNVVFGGSNSSLSVTGNIVNAASLQGISTSSYPNNTWKSSKPGGVQVYVRPNIYEPNRANITIFNWDKAGTVSLAAAQLAGVQIQPGNRYELRNVQNYYGDVVTGTYDGNAIPLPMTGRSVAQPTGLDFKPASSFPEFGGFVLIVIP